MALTEREKAVLDFERTWWTEDGTKEERIVGFLGLTETSYYELLNELLDRPDALEHDPLVVRRLRRGRERRRRLRLDAAAGGSDR